MDWRTELFVEESRANEQGTDDEEGDDLCAECHFPNVHEQQASHHYANQNTSCDAAVLAVFEDAIKIEDESGDGVNAQGYRDVQVRIFNESIAAEPHESHRVSAPESPKNDGQLILETA